MERALSVLLLAILGLAFSSNAVAQPAHTSRTSEKAFGDDQWIYRPTVYGKGHPTTAAFLSDDYSSVLFRVWCENKNRLVIQYFGDGVTALRGQKIAIGADDQGYRFTELKTTFSSYGLSNGKPNVLEGRITVTPSFAKMILSARDIAIDAPNEEGEEWHTGSATPLKKIVSNCH